MVKSADHQGAGFALSGWDMVIWSVQIESSMKKKVHMDKHFQWAIVGTWYTGQKYVWYYITVNVLNLMYM